MIKLLFSNVGVYHYLFLSIILFLIGLMGVIVSKNLIRLLLSIEILLNAVCLNFIVIANFCDRIKLEGNTFAIFIMFISIIQAVIISAIIINIYRHKKISAIDKLKDLKG